MMRNPVPGGAPVAGGKLSPVGEPMQMQEGEGGTPEQVRAALVAILQRAKALADNYGIDLNALVAELGSRRPSAPTPPPPSSAPPMG